MPDVIPVATPVVLPIVPTAVVPLLQVPPVTASVSDTLAPAHTCVVPVIVPAAGNEFTEMIAVAYTVPQPFVTPYEIVAVPNATPVTIPVDPTEAVDGAPLVHVPPLTAFVSVILAPVQTEFAPFIVPALGNGLTVTTVVA